MKVIWIPTSPEAWIGILATLAIVVGFLVTWSIWTRIFPPKLNRLLKDGRYLEALNCYRQSLQTEAPTRSERRDAFAAAVSHLIKEHGIPVNDAGANFKLLATQHDRDKSYELRSIASEHEQDGAYGLALLFYDRAALWQVDHDPKDYQFLLACSDRVRRHVKGRQAPDVPNENVFDSDSEYDGESVRLANTPTSEAGDISPKIYLPVLLVIAAVLILWFSRQ